MVGKANNSDDLYYMSEICLFQYVLISLLTNLSSEELSSDI